MTRTSSVALATALLVATPGRAGAHPAVSRELDPSYASGGDVCELRLDFDQRTAATEDGSARRYVGAKNWSKLLAHIECDTHHELAETPALPLAPVAKLYVFVGDEATPRLAIAHARLRYAKERKTTFAYDYGDIHHTVETLRAPIRGALVKQLRTTATQLTFVGVDEHGKTALVLVTSVDEDAYPIEPPS